MQESPTTGVPNHLVLSIVRACSRVKLFTHLFWRFLPLREFGHHHVPGSCFSSLLIIIYSSVLQHRSRVSKVFFGVSCNTAIGQGGAPWHPGRWSVNLPVDPLGDYTQVDLRRWRSTHSRRRQKVGVSLGGDANMLYHGTRLLAWYPIKADAMMPCLLYTHTLCLGSCILILWVPLHIALVWFEPPSWIAIISYWVLYAISQREGAGLRHMRSINPWGTAAKAIMQGGVYW